MNLPFSTLFVVDDNQSFRKSLVFLLEGLGFNVVAFDSAEAALPQMADLEPTHLACLMLDIRMPTMSGLELHDALQEKGIDMPIIYMTGHADVSLAVAAMRKGALTFLEKPIDEAQMQTALLQAFSPAVQCQRRSAAEHSLAKKRRDEINTLSQRECEVLKGIVDGQTGKQIAQEIGVSPKTVEYHRGRLFKRLDAANVAQLQRVVAIAGVTL